MISTLLPMAAEPIPNFYEPGWDWWAWPLAWLAYALAALVLAAIGPVFSYGYDAPRGSALRWPAIIGGLVLILAAVVVGFMGSGALMRHMDAADGALLVFLGRLLVAGLGAVASMHICAWWFEGLSDVARWLAFAAPAVVVGLGAIANGIGEAITRFAASVPIPVGQAGAILVLGLLLLGLWGYGRTRS